MFLGITVRHGSIEQEWGQGSPMEEERKVPSMFSGAMRVAATSSTLYSDSNDMFIYRYR